MISVMFFYLQIFYQFMSFLTPGIIYRCDMTTDSSQPQVVKTCDINDFCSIIIQTYCIFCLSVCVIFQHSTCYNYESIKQGTRGMFDGL